MTTKSLTDCYGRRLTVENGRPGIHVHASETVGPFTSEQLRAALDEVAPAGSYTRTDEADWKARAEKDLDDARAKAVKWMVRAKETEADRDKWRGEAMQLLAANERLERERDEARGALRARLGVRAEPRPLTPDAITAEMVQRGVQVLKTTDKIGAFFVRDLLTAALTEPPKRPDGAEDWEDWLIEALPHESMPDEDIALLADRIAARLTEKNTEKEEDR